MDSSYISFKVNVISLQFYFYNSQQTWIELSLELREKIIRILYSIFNQITFPPLHIR